MPRLLATATIESATLKSNAPSVFCRDSNFISFSVVMLLKCRSNSAACVWIEPGSTAAPIGK
jgi:hypothetical protein